MGQQCNNPIYKDMEQRTINIQTMINFFKKRQRFWAIYSSWCFIHLLLLVAGDNMNGFFPFGRYGMEIEYYGLVEFLFYTIAPLIAIFIAKSFNEEN